MLWMVWFLRQVLASTDLLRVGFVSDLHPCTVPDTPTFTTLSNLIEVSTKFQNNLQEITMTSNVCDEASTTPTSSTQIHVATSDSCWQLVHPDHHNVYDMTSWVSAHPGKIIKTFTSSFIFVEPVYSLCSFFYLCFWFTGGGDKITAFAESGCVLLVYPHHHKMSRWEQNKHAHLDAAEGFRLVGKEHQRHHLANHNIMDGISAVK